MAAAVIFDVIANQPPATAFNNRFFFYATDTNRMYVSDGSTWQTVGTGGGGSIEVTDGVTTVNPTSEIDFTAGATVTDLGGGVAGVAISAAADISVTDGSTTVDPVSEIDFTSGATITDGGSGVAQVAISGALPSWFQSGSGSPVGSVTPDQINAIYVDIDALTPGGVYQAFGATSADWVAIGGAAAQTVPGVSLSNGALVLLADVASSSYFGDVEGLNGTGNGVYWVGNGADGAQILVLRTGPSGEFLGTLQDDAGNLKPGNTIDVSGIPTANPGPGLLWNNAGVLAIGT